MKTLAWATDPNTSVRDKLHKAIDEYSPAGRHWNEGPTDTTADNWPEAARLAIIATHPDCEDLIEAVYEYIADASNCDDEGDTDEYETAVAMARELTEGLQPSEAQASAVANDLYDALKDALVVMQANTVGHDNWVGSVKTKAAKALEKAKAAGLGD